MSEIPVDLQERIEAYATIVTENGRLTAEEVIDRLNGLVDCCVLWAIQELSVLDAAGVLDGNAIIALQEQHPHHNFVVLTDGRRWSRPAHSTTAHYRLYEGGEPTSNCGCGAC